MGFFDRPTGGKTLYHPGCLAAAKLPHVVKATKDVLRDMHVQFVVIDGLIDCGHHAWYAGYEADFEKIMQKNKELLKKHGITQVITNDPHCCHCFTERYGIETKHTLQVFDEHLDKIKKKDTLQVSYHHPCYLDKLGIDEKMAVRVLRRANVHVAPDNKPRGCCGSVGDDFGRNNKEVARRIADRRREQLRERVLVTACPYCITMFKNARDVAELLTEV
jgi:Fe-S oxidoreductase